MYCIKLLGQHLSARDLDRQVAKFQVRVAVLNGFNAFDRPIAERVGKSKRGLRTTSSTRFVQHNQENSSNVEVALM